jgi:hypothetical protein
MRRIENFAEVATRHVWPIENTYTRTDRRISALYVHFIHVQRTNKNALKKMRLWDDVAANGSGSSSFFVVYFMTVSISNCVASNGMMIGES